MVALFVLATIVTCVLVEIVLDRVTKRKQATVREPVTLGDRFVIPRGYFLSRSHSWAELLPTGNVRIGIDDFVQKLVGTIDTVITPAIDKDVREGDSLFTIRQGGRMLSVPAPISGRILEVNPTLHKTPTTLKNDPYVSGWVAVIAPTGLAGELKLLKVAEDAVQWLRDEIRRFRNFIQQHASSNGKLALAGVTLLDGGMPLAGILQRTDEKTWKEFESDFLAVGNNRAATN